MKDTVVGRIEQLTQASGAPIVPTFTGSTAFIADNAALQARVAELEKSHARYEFLRTLNVPQFQALYLDNIQRGIPFDDLVDEAIGMKRLHDRKTDSQRMREAGFTTRRIPTDQEETDR